MWLHVSRSAMSPSQLRQPRERPALLALPKATPALLLTARELGWNTVTDDGYFSIRIGGQYVSAGAEPDVERARQRPGPKSWALFTLVRQMLADPGTSQLALARRGSLSQSRASRLLSGLVDQGLVVHGRGWWKPSDWESLANWWQDNYPGPGGTVSYWAALDSPAGQVEKALKVLGLPGRARLAVSGDVAADALAPWRRPSRGIIYSEYPTSLAKDGFVLVSSSDEATLEVRAPADQGVWLPQEWTAHSRPLADPMQIIWDTGNGPEPDRDEAVQPLRESLQTRHAGSWASAVRGRA